MMSEFRNNMLVGFLTALIAFGPFFVMVDDAQAQEGPSSSGGYGSSSGGYGSSSGGYSTGGSVGAGGNGWLNVGGVAGTALSCAIGTGMIGDALESAGSAIGSAFGGAGDTGSAAAGAMADIIAGDAAGAAASAGAAGASAVSAATQVPVTDAQTHQNQKDTTEKVQINNKKEYCWDKITKELVTRVMDKATLAIVDWVNNGYQGDPFFVEDFAGFAANIAVGEIDGFINFYTSSNVAGDFAQAVAEAIVQNIQRSTYARFQNSLALVLAHGTPEEFHADFNVGGWAGYTALFEPQNNPFGSYLLASDEIGRRISGTSYTRFKDLNKQLDLSGGIFDQQVCSLTATGNPADEYIDKTDIHHIPPGTPVPAEVLAEVGMTPSTPIGTVESNVYIAHLRQLSVCAKWRTQTPGYLIANQVSDVSGSWLRQLELTDEFQEDLALIMDAFINQVINGGITGSDPRDNSDPNSNVLIAQAQGLLPGQQANSIPITDAINGTDFDPGIVAVQQAYMTQALINNLPKISEAILDIRMLDYCVPGPNPKWYNFAVSRLQNAITSTPPSSSIDPDDAQIYYALKVQEFTGINLLPTPYIQTYTDFADFLIYTFTAYRDAMYGEYSINEAPPSMRPALYNLFNQISTLNDEMIEIQNHVNALSTIMPQLLDIQAQINALLGDGIDANDDPNSPEMQAIADVFADIANAGLVNQSDLDTLIARVNVYNYIISQATNFLTTCIAETVTDAGYEPDERTAYPTEAGLSGHPSFSAIPPADPMYLDNLQFGDSPGQIDLSAFHDADITVPSTDVDEFQNFLGVY